MGNISGSMHLAWEENMIMEVREAGRFVKFSPVSKESTNEKKIDTQRTWYWNQEIQGVFFFLKEKASGPLFPSLSSKHFNKEVLHSSGPCNSECLLGRQKKVP